MSMKSPDQERVIQELASAALPEKETEKACYHCGLPCPNDTVSIGDKYFCCQGCRMVYEILEANDLCQYYQLTENPGVSPKEFNAAARFAYLDDESVRNQLLDFSDGKTAKVTFQIPAMHCSSCIWLLEKLYGINRGILASRVDFLRKEVSVTFSETHISLRQVVELLTSLGYEPHISLQDVHAKARKDTNRDLYIKLGLAGFAFGNIMLLSFPEYLSGGDMEAQFKQFFGYVNILLALPVLLYSGIDYFKSAISGLKHKTINIDVPIALGITTLFGRSLYEILYAGGAGYMDSFVALIFLLLLGKLFQKKTYDRLSFERDYKSYFPVSVTRKEGDEEKNVPLSKLKIGDRITIRNQELIPADSVLINGKGWIDYSFVTGESEPVEKKSGDMIYAGGRQAGSAIELEVIKEVSQSYLTQLWNNDAFSKHGEGRISGIVNVVSKYFTLVVLLIATLSALYWFPHSINMALNAFTAVLIIACPCALALSVPFTLGNSLRIFGRNQFYLKNSAVIESIAKITTILFDKTGTLTKSRKSQVNFISLNGKAALSAEENRLIKSLVHHSTHPLSRRIELALNGEVSSAVENFREIPGEGIEGIVEQNQLKIGSASFAGSAGASPEDATATTVYISLNGRVKGYFQLDNYYRPGLNEVLQNSARMYRLALISGDNESEKENLQPFFSGETQLRFNQSPRDKLEYVKELQSNRQRVLMVGDGLNDAGALKQSDVGIAVTEDLNAFSPACDAILDARQFPRLFQFIQFAKMNIRIILASFAISFLYNIIGFGFAVQGTLSPLISAILMPLSSISVILFATAATYLTAHKAGLHEVVKTGFNLFSRDVAPQRLKGITATSQRHM